MAVVSTQGSPLTTRQLLVSVQNADEAATAFACGVPWVDLKNPAAGSLGQPPADVCQEFVALASQCSSSSISVALGEFDQLDWSWLEHWLPEFGVGKVGMTGHRRSDPSITKQLLPYIGHIVPALYADWQRAGSPPPEDILQLAESIDAPFLLIDTCIKDGLGLLHWLGLDELLDLQAKVLSMDAGLVLAGSLRSSDWPVLERMTNITIGIRGAACQTSADRTSQLNTDALHSWLKWCNHRA